MKRLLLLIAITICFISLLPKNVNARSGCCSHHDGVCGCRCCDGTPLSNTCAPYYPSCSQPAYIAPVSTKIPIPTNTPKPPTPRPTVKPTLIPTLFPTLRPTRTPTLIPTNFPTSEPQIKSFSTEVTQTPIVPAINQEKTETKPSDVFLGLGIFSTLAFGLFWTTRKVLRKIISLFKK